MKPTLATLALFVFLGTSAEAAETKRSTKKALKPLQDLIGSWRGTGTPAGTREEQQKGFWQETITWQWQFKGDDAWLRADIEKGKWYTRLELRYLPEKDVYQLKAQPTGKEKEEQTFEGKREERKLTLRRDDPKTKQTQQLVLNVLHFNRYLFRCETKRPGSSVFARVYEVGATKNGVAFAGDDDKPECVVSGGLGTIPVMHKGKTYYVCCTGCRDAFKDDPEKYIKEYEENKKKKKKAE
jgi:hypothetical protein